MGYLICENCRSYYELKEGESPEDFLDKCECGGKLRYAENIDIVSPDWEEAPINDNQEPISTRGLGGWWNKRNNITKTIGILSFCCLGVLIIIGLFAFISPDSNSSTNNTTTVTSENTFNNQYISFNYPNTIYIEESSDNGVLTGKEKENDTNVLFIDIIPVDDSSDYFTSNPETWQKNVIKESETTEVPILDKGNSTIDGIKAVFIYDDLYYDYYLVKGNLTYSISFNKDFFTKNQVQDILNSMKIK